MSLWPIHLHAAGGALVFHYVQPLLLIVYGTALILGGILLFLAVIGAAQRLALTADQ